MFRKLTCLGMVLALCSISAAATIQWKNIASGNWETASNWGGGIPPSINDQILAYRSDNSTSVITITASGASAGKFQMKYGTMTLNINAGASLTNNGSAEIYNGTSATINIYGTWTSTPGAYPLGLKLGGVATDKINVYGLLTVHNASNNATLEMGHAAAGSGTLTIYSGGVADIDTYNWLGLCPSLIDIKSGGRLKLYGDVRATVIGDIALGRLVGNGIVNNLITKLDGTKTIVQVQDPVEVTVSAGTSAGWDFYDLNTNIGGGDSIDLGDLNIIAQHWLNSSCSDSNYWCARADLDQSSSVDFSDYAILVNDWDQAIADKILLQTIYGTAQDSAGNITANNSYTLNKNQGIAMAFKVTEHTAIDKAVLKCFNIAASNQIRVRLYDVNGLGFLTYGHSMTRTSPGSTGTKIIDFTSTLPASIPSHTELSDGRAYSDLSLTFAPQEVNAGDYLLVLDANGPANTWGNIIRGSGIEPVAMGQYPDGVALPKQATVTTNSNTGNTYFYQLTGSADSSYTPASNLLAFQITLNQAPKVNVGTDQTIYDPANSVTLDATVTDDGLPQPSNITVTWSKIKGPGTVTFGNVNAIDTTATFSALGLYILRLTASDGQIEGHDDITVTVMPASGNTIIYHVTNTASSGAGSFSSYLTLANTDGLPSKIVFDVGGIFVSPSSKTISEDNTTIYGFSAPSPGVTFDFNAATPGFSISGSNCKFCNITVTNTFKNSDGLHITGNNNVVERCTFTWCRDEGVTVAQGTGNVVTFCRIEFCGSQPGDGSGGGDGRGISISYQGSQATVVGNYVGDCLRGVLCGDYGTDIFADFRHNLVTNTHSNYAFTIHASSFANLIQNTIINNNSDGLKYMGGTFYRSGNTLSANSGGNETYSGSWTEVFVPITKPNTPFPSWLNTATTPASKNDVGQGTGDCISCQ